VVALIVLAAVAALLFRLQSRRDFAIGRTGPLPGGTASPALHAVRDEGTDRDGRSGRDAHDGRSAVSARNRERATHYVDSASGSGDDWERAIRFYKIALSFNRHNVGAWHGLVSAYRGAGMTAEAEEALAEMRELFGEDALGVADLVEPYGTLVDYVQESRGVCRIEYRSRTTGRPNLTRQAYGIVRALAVEHRCRAVTVYAATGKGKGLLVHAKADRLPATVSAFERQSSISYLE
jgi:hypothetical protein